MEHRARPVVKRIPAEDNKDPNYSMLTNRRFSFFLEKATGMAGARQLALLLCACLIIGADAFIGSPAARLFASPISQSRSLAQVNKKHRHCPEARGHCSVQTHSFDAIPTRANDALCAISCMRAWRGRSRYALRSFQYSSPWRARWEFK